MLVYLLLLLSRIVAPKISAFVLWNYVVALFLPYVRSQIYFVCNFFGILLILFNIVLFIPSYHYQFFSFVGTYSV